MFYQDSNYKKISLIIEAEGQLHPIVISKEDYSVRRTKKPFEGAVLLAGGMFVISWNRLYRDNKKVELRLGSSSTFLDLVE